MGVLKILGLVILGAALLLVLVVQLVKLWALLKYGKEKSKSIGHWLNASVYVGAFGLATEWLMFWPAWFLRDWDKNPFWWWLDDERIDADDYKSYLIRYGKSTETTWIAYKWHLRNTVWNLKRDKFRVHYVPPPNGVGNNYITVESVPIDGIFKRIPDEYGGYLEHKVDQAGPWIITAGLKFVPRFKWENPWQVNQGILISYLTSLVGEGFMWFYPGAQTKEKLMFRYSHCKIIKYKILGVTLWHGYRTVKLGYGQASYVLTVKHQEIKPWGIDFHNSLNLSNLDDRSSLKD